MSEDEENSPLRPPLPPSAELNMKSFSVVSSPMKHFFILQPTLPQNEGIETVLVAEQPNFVEKIGDLHSKAKYFELRPENMPRCYSEQIPIHKNEKLVRETQKEEEKIMPIPPLNKKSTNKDVQKLDKDTSK